MMNNIHFDQIAIFSAEAIITALLVLVLFRVRPWFGLSPLYVTLGVFQPIQVLLASSIYVEILPNIVISPGSVVMFTASLFAVLLVYIQEDALETRKAIYGIMIANLAMTLLLFIFGMQVDRPNTLNFLGLPSEVFNQNARVMLSGTIFLFADVFLIIFTYELIGRWIKRSLFLRIYLTIAAILVFDSVGFCTGAFYDQPEYSFILLSGIVGKLGIAVFYAAAMTIYLRFFEHEQHIPQPFQDIFSALTYRQKYEVERNRGVQTLAALKVSENRFRELAANIQEVFWVLDWQEQKVLYVSPAYETIWGRSPESLLENSEQWAQSVHPDDLDSTMKSLQRSLETSGEAREYRIIRPDGTVRWISDRGFPVLDEDGVVVRIVGTAEDITKRKRYETIQHIQYKVASAMVTATSLESLFALVRAEIARLMNNQYLRLVLYDKESRLLRDPFEMDDKDNKPGRWDIDNSLTSLVIQEKKTILLKKEDFQRLIHNGEIEEHDNLPEAWLGIPLLVEEEVIGAIVLENDDSPELYDEGITQLLETIAHNIGNFISRRKSEADRERLNAAIEQSAESVVITDAEGIIRYVNPAFEKNSGYARAEVLGNTSRIIMSGEHSQIFYDELWNTISSGQVWSGKTINRRKDGSLFTEESTISPVFDTDGNISNYVAVKRDITKEQELVQQFQQAQKMESIGRLAGGVAHDFNNMLSVIMGYSELALKKLTPEDRFYADIQEIYNAGRRSAELTSQLLAFARKQTIKPQTLNLNNVISEMLKLLRRLIGEETELVWKPGAQLDNIFADPSQIDQILANLCVNARDSIEGSGKIIIDTDNIILDEAYCQTYVYAKPGPYIVLAVSDNGCGMSKETLAHVFEPFFTTKPEGQGTGLGLSTVYGIVKQNEGFINGYSEVGKGTSFKIYFPRHSASGLPKEVKTETEFPGHGERILLVEDEPAILQITKSMLESIGYSVITANTPQEALRIAQEEKDEIDLLVTDVVMPVMNGKELADQLYSFYPAMKVLFISGYTSDIIAHHGVLDKGVNFLTKPFSLAVLAKQLHEMLTRQP